MTVRAHVICAIALAAASCSAPRRSLQPVTLPDLTRLDASVQAQVRDRYDRVKRASDDRSTPVASLASAYGDYGMVMQAAEYFDAAEPAYLNAQALAPDDVRWPYYLANLYKSRGETDKAEAAFKRALQLQPNDVATLVWLGRLHLDQGKTDEAEALFQKANTQSPNTVAVIAGLGRAAVAKRDYAGAVKYLEQALAIDPEAEGLHAPLAAAYRGLGQIDKARPHIGQWQNKDLPVPDPRQEELDLLLDSGLSYELRGIRAFEVRNWKAAAELFRRGLAVTAAGSPLRRSLQHKLGTALALQGDNVEAEKQFQAVIDAHAPGIDEATAKAHYSLGVMMASDGRAAQALPHFEAAIASQPNYIEAHLALADFLRRHKRPDAALDEYRATLALNPRHSVARLGYAMCLQDLKRYRETRAWLEDAVKDAPDRVEYKIALARVLAASPDAAVRDGQKALDLAQELFKLPQHTTALGETIAMALAEYGDFAQAMSIQRDVIAAARRSGLGAQLPRMEQNLALYERHQPCRTPWSDDDLVLSAQSPAAPPSSS
ncbi:MAG TPA: tetratricopeptide repeat protein [Vicinamibacterales bacterium]|nr:tetratricopeptide repeat protein [Vicinamibacterales bacterium]